MPEYDDHILHEVDGIAEYDNPVPAWLQAMFFGGIAFSVIYVAVYALAFGGDSYDAEYRDELVADKAAAQAYFAANPLQPPTAEALLAGAVDPEVLARGGARYAKTCAPCHGDAGQGLIGPNLTDDAWLHGGKVTEIWTVIVGGVPAKGMPTWGRAFAPEEVSAVTSFVRSLHGASPAGGRAPEGAVVAMEPLPTSAP